jgi:CRISPR-associated protein Cmr2
MEELIASLDPDGTHTILPRKDNIHDQTPLFGAGIYPDRLFMKADGLTTAKIDTAINNALKAVIGEVIPKNTDNNTVDSAFLFWKQYFRIEYVVLPLDSIQNGILINDTKAILDTIELTDTFFPTQPTTDFLLKLLTDLYTYPIWNHLKKEKDNGAYKEFINGLFPSTHQIAHLEIWQRYKEEYKEAIKSLPPDDDQTEIYQALEANATIKHALSDYHKYYCIVYADGDQIGNTIASLANEDSYRAFSNKLSDFAATSAGIINHYGGKPIYIGGDDLLFLAPVYAQNGSILQIIQALDKEFQTLNLEGSPTLSFGVSVTYYKYPLFESIDVAYSQLMAAKEYKKGNAKKNAVGIRLVRHSGSEFGVLLQKDFLTALINVQTNLRNQTSETLLSSLVYKLRTLEDLLTATLQTAATGQAAACLENLLSNYFNDSFTAGRNLEDQKKSIAALTLAAWEHFPDPPDHEPDDCDDDGSNPKWTDHLYGALRLLKFMTDQPKSNQP